MSRVPYMQALSLLLVIGMIVSTTPASAFITTTTIFEDDFNYSSDAEASANWLIMREVGDPTKEVVWSPAESRVYLTTASRSANGGLYLKGVDLRFLSYWKLEAIVFIGNNTPRADGLAITFFHNNVLGFGGGNMGARLNGAQGLLIEIDTYNNGEGLLLPHVALANAETPASVHSHVYTQGAHSLLDRWIYIQLEFNRTEFTPSAISGYLTLRIWDGANLATKEPAGSLIVDSTLYLTVPADLGWLGFTAATGYYYEVHALDWMRLTGPVPMVGGDAYISVGSSTIYPLLAMAIALLYVAASRRLH